METLRFLMVTTHYPPFHIGGDAVMVMNLSHELLSRGHEVHVLSSPSVFRMIRGEVDSPEDHVMENREFIHEFEMKTKRLGIGLTHVLGLWGRAERKLNELNSSLTPDIIHWHNTRAFIGRQLQMNRAMNLYTAHDYTAICPRGNLLRHDSCVCTEPRQCQICLLRSGKAPQLWRVGRRVALPAPTVKVLTPSEFMARRLKHDAVPIREVVRNFVPDPGIKREKCSEKRTIVYVGILEPHKGLKTLLDAFASSSEHHDFRLVIIGTGSQLDWLKSEVRREELEHRVSIKGLLERNSMLNLMSESEAVIVPSEWYENAPLVALEALSLGVPLVTSDMGGLPEIVRTAKGSSLFPAQDSARLAGRIVELWNDLENLGARSSAARDAYESMYTPDKHMESYMRVISDTGDG